MTQGYYEHDQEARTLLASVEWVKAEVVEVTPDNFTFAPQDIKLERTRPSILRLKNVGTQTHDMSGGDFFQVALIKQVSIGAGRIVTPYIQSIQIRPRHKPKSGCCRCEREPTASSAVSRGTLNVAWKARF